MSHIGPDPKQLPPEHSRSALAMVGIEYFVRQMEHEFHPFDPPETGIDGSIELSDPVTRSMTGKVIFVQSRSHKGEFKDETDDGFSFPLDRRDLDGWMAMTVPVILIVSRPTETTLVQARERPRALGPAAGSQARRLLAQIAPKLSQTCAETAAEILRDEVEFYGFTRGESAGALAELTNRGVVDSIPFFVRLVLEEDDPGVSIAGYLRTAPDDLQRQVVAAARGGNFLALAEAAAADLPDRYPELRELCSREIQNLLDLEPEEGVQQLAVNYRRHADLGRHSGRSRQRQLIEYLLGEVFSPQTDPMTRVSAINGLGSLARGVEKNRADRCLTQLLPMAAGGDFSVISEEGPGRRVHRELYLDTNGGTQAAAIVACAWLARRARPGSRRLRAVVSAALDDERAPVAIAALRVIAGMPNIRAGHQLEDFFDDSRPSVREAAQRLVGSGSEDTSGT